MALSGEKGNQFCLFLFSFIPYIQRSEHSALTRRFEDLSPALFGRQSPQRSQSSRSSSLKAEGRSSCLKAEGRSSSAALLKSRRDAPQEYCGNLIFRLQDMCHGNVWQVLVISCFFTGVKVYPSKHVIFLISCVTILVSFVAILVNWPRPVL